MANTIQVKRSAVPAKVPTTTDLALGEIAVNTYDGKMYIKKDNGTASVVEIGGSTGSGDVVGPSSATDNALARFDTTTGKLIQNSVGILSDTGSLSGLTDIQNINYVDFDTGYSTTITTGQLGWDSTNNSLAFGMAGGNIVQHIGEDQYFYIKASSAITKGQVIMFTGSVGASGVLTGAPATSITDGTYIMGVAAETIALNGFGFVQTFGVLKNVDTSAFADGDILWYNPSVTGGLTATKPSAPNVKVQVAACNKGGSAGGGVITVRINAGSQLGGTDSNVQFGSLASGQTVIYDATAGYWKNATLTAGTGISITNGAGSITINATNAGTVTSVSGTAPIASTGGATPVISISQATTSTNGYLSSTDWNTFNNKQPAGSYLTTVTANSPLSGSGTAGSPLIIAQATTSTNGYLSSTDWTTFNNKQTALVSGTNIKTVNGTTLLGSGDLGTIGIGYGGTGQTTANASFNALAPSQTSNSGKFLTTDGTNTSWGTPTATAAAGGGIWVNAQTITTSYTIASGYNGLSVGPITISSGTTITVSTGSIWQVL